MKETGTRTPQRLLLIITDITSFRVHVRKEKTDEKKKKKIEYPFIVRNINHWIEKINLGGILRDDTFRETPLQIARETGMLTVVYRYGHTVRCRLFNYKETVAGFQKADMNDIDCACSSFAFTNGNHGHVVTGNL